MKKLPPSYYSPDLTDDRLTLIAEKLLDVRYEVIDTLSSEFDDNYTRETAAYGRQRNMLIKLALSNEYGWLSLNSSTMDVTFSIGKIPCRFFTDDPLHPHKDGFFKKNSSDNLFELDNKLPVTWRFVIAKGLFDSEEEKVYFVGYNVFNEIVSEWIYSGVTNTINTTDIVKPMSVNIPAAQIEIRESNSDEKTG